MEVEEQVAVLYAGINGYLDDLEVSQVREFEKKLVEYLKSEKSEVLQKIREEKDLTEETEKLLKEAIEEFKSEFVKIYGK